ncbi:homoserine kinase [Tessaracoccus bendigoensis DSM 12906]|uniref:Homoserine kinase n=1 Tax=Tessaracoccus bendigoensis DSM 12906 TaxID=1123357 RepID=A0A1M6GF31_9ACTN|nr:homoserine kinase [Tessaracoccus bendigoensis]SHJ08574.1 homoserine kinase [Tessaracoccus bendigoensis DSM 12906]
MGRRVTVRVPATTANVGSGFDCIGIALDLYDDLSLTLLDDPRELSIEVFGEGAGSVPLDERHLVVSSLLTGLEAWGVARPGMALACRNRIPHSRGLGSSAAAIVGGLALAWGIAHPGEPLDLAELTRISSRLEGHPDNAGAAVWGGAILAWFTTDEVRLIQLDVPDALATRVWIPEFEVPTAGARAVLPDSVPRADAVAQAIASSALPLALERRHDLLLKATGDLLHQSYRASLMPQSWDLMNRLRADGVPAAISGAGPAVFAIGTAEQIRVADECGHEGFVRLGLGLGAGVQLRCSD